MPRLRTRLAAPMAALLLAAGVLPAPPAAADDDCLACHHQPDFTATWHGRLGPACTACHARDAARHGALVGGDLAGTCRTCHDTDRRPGRVTHKPVAEGDCGDCHAMHATERAALLSDPLSTLCTVCHRKVGLRPHALATLSGRSHPVGGSALGDPSQPSRALQCVSCHDPHRSDSRRLLRHGGGTGLCQACHRK